MAQKQNLRVAAQVAADTARTSTIRMLARERGGITPRTRDAIFAEADAAAKFAAQQVYLDAGYGYCDHPDTCPNLTSPGFTTCPEHSTLRAFDKRRVARPQQLSLQLA